MGADVNMFVLLFYNDLMIMKENDGMDAFSFWKVCFGNLFSCCYLPTSALAEFPGEQLDSGQWKYIWSTTTVQSRIRSATTSPLDLLLYSTENLFTKFTRPYKLLQASPLLTIPRFSPCFFKTKTYGDHLSHDASPTTTHNNILLLLFTASYALTAARAILLVHIVDDATYDHAWRIMFTVLGW